MQNPWQVNNPNNGLNSQVLQTNQSTTPWPTLNQRRNQMPSQNNANNQPMWVQNGSNWVRNSPTPTQPAPFSNMNSNRLQNNRNNVKNTAQNIPTAVVTSPKTLNAGQNRHSPVNFVTTPRMPAYNSQNNVNKNFLDNEKTKFAGGSFSLGSFSGSQDSTINKSDSPSGGDVDDNELRDFSETLLSKDTNNAAKYITINVQKMTSSRSTVDEAPLP